MNEQSKQLVEEALKTLLVAVQSGTALVKEQVPIILQQKLTYDFYYYLFFVVLWTCINIGCLYGSRRLWKWGGEKGEGGATFAAVIGYILFGVGWFVILENNLSSMIMIHLPPTSTCWSG
jgi:hypothetical protein